MGHPLQRTSPIPQASRQLHRTQKLQRFIHLIPLGRIATEILSRRQIIPGSDTTIKQYRFHVECQGFTVVQAVYAVDAVQTSTRTYESAAEVRGESAVG